MIELITLSALSVYGLGSSIRKIYETFTGNNFNIAVDILKLSDKKIYYALMPLCLCRTCMSSVWGTVFYFWWGVSMYDLLLMDLLTNLPISIISIAGVVYFMVSCERGY